MNIFRKLWLLLHPKDDAFIQGVKAYTASDIAELRDFRNSEGFKVFTRLLDNGVNIYAETLLSSRDVAALHEARGVIIGLRQAVLLVDETLNAHSRLDDAERREREQQLFAGDQRNISTFGSPAWRGRSD